MNKVISKMKYLKVALYNILFVVLLTALFEISIRIFIPEIKLSGTDSSLFRDTVCYNSIGLVPRTTGLSNGVVKSVDDNGFWKYKRSNNGKRILLLGDSVTMGIGVENDSTFAGILNNYSDSLSIYNPSLIAYTGNDYKNILNKLISDNHNAFGFDNVVICWTLNDIYPNHPLENAPGLVKDGIITSLTSLLRKNFYFFHFLKNLFSDRSAAYYAFDSAI